MSNLGGGPRASAAGKNQKHEKIANIFKNCLNSRYKNLDKLSITSIKYAVLYYRESSVALEARET